MHTTFGGSVQIGCKISTRFLFPPSYIVPTEQELLEQPVCFRCVLPDVCVLPFAPNTNKTRPLVYRPPVPWVPTVFPLPLCWRVVANCLASWRILDFVGFNCPTKRLLFLGGKIVYISIGDHLYRKLANDSSSKRPGDPPKSWVGGVAFSIFLAFP